MHSFCYVRRADGGHERVTYLSVHIAIGSSEMIGISPSEELLPVSDSLVFTGVFYAEFSVRLKQSHL